MGVPRRPGVGGAFPIGASPPTCSFCVGVSLVTKSPPRSDREPADHRAIEEQLRECRARLKGVADNLPGGVVFQNMTSDGSDRNFLYVSESCERVLGVRAEDAMANPQAIYDLIVEEHRQAFTDAENAAIAAKTRFDGEIQFRRTDGELRWSRVVASPRHLGGRSVVFDGVILDTTEQKLAHEAELRALRYQVNPHFLFNSLNAVSTLILDQDAGKAEKMVMNLASFYRSSLQLDPLQLHPLADEVLLQKLYLDVEKVRFPDELQLDLRVDPDVEAALVPGMILQPIIENAIKYGIGAAGTIMTLAIQARCEGDRLVIAVRNDRQAAGRRPGTGFGLKMTRRRLEMAFGQNYSFEAGPVPGGGYSVEMSVPIRFREVQLAPAIDD